MAEAYIWVYEPRHLHSGLSFGETALQMAYPERLIARAKRISGGDYSPPFLATNHGIENPVLIYVDDKLLSFFPEIKFGIVSADERPRDITDYATRASEIRGMKPIPESLQGRGFEVWALNQYPNPESREWTKYDDATGPLFDPQVSRDELKGYVQKVYEGLIAYDPSIGQELPGAKHRPVVLGWYVGDGRFRIATRPYKPEGERHKLSIATTFQNELYERALPA